MLFGEPTEHGAGLILWGDYYDLENLYETAGVIADSIEREGTMSDLIMALCYDIRHAYQGGREKKEFKNNELNKVNYYGVKILWPYFIVPVGLLRWAAAYTTTNSDQQSNLYRIEHIVETTLKVVSFSVAEECMGWLKHFSGFPNDYPIQFLDELSYRFVFDESIHRIRINRLPTILKMSLDVSQEYNNFKENLLKIAHEKACHPDDLSVRNEWPEFSW